MMCWTSSLGANNTRTLDPQHCDAVPNMNTSITLPNEKHLTKNTEILLTPALNFKLLLAERW